MTRVRYDKETVAEWIKLYAEGWTCQRIADGYGTYAQTVWLALRRNGVQTRGRGYPMGRPKSERSRLELLRALELRGQGLTLEQIARRLGGGRTRQAVEQMLKRAPHMRLEPKETGQSLTITFDTDSA